MNMQTIETIVFANTERIAVATVCLLGAGFMILFFIALFLQGRKTCPRSLIPGGTQRYSSATHLYSDDRQSEISRAGTTRQNAAL
jgi:hypothetical protein